MWEADHHGWKADEGAPVPFITAGFDVRFLRPTPLGPPLSLRAEPMEVSDSAIVVSAELAFEEKVRATMVATWLDSTLGSSRTPVLLTARWSVHIQCRSSWKKALASHRPGGQGQG